jgi:hypothetical protein
MYLNMHATSVHGFMHGSSLLSCDNLSGEQMPKRAGLTPGVTTQHIYRRMGNLRRSEVVTSSSRPVYRLLMVTPAQITIIKSGAKIRAIMDRTQVCCSF